jgi:hypothetical protein
MNSYQTSLLQSMDCLRKYAYVRDGILHFYDEESCVKTYAYLRDLIKNCQIAFSKTDVDAENYVLDIFGLKFNFASLRKYIQAKRNSLIFSNSLHSENDPDDIFFQDKVVQSFVTTAYDVFVGNKLHNVGYAQRSFLDAKRSWAISKCAPSLSIDSAAYYNNVGYPQDPPSNSAYSTGRISEGTGVICNGISAVLLTQGTYTNKWQFSANVHVDAISDCEPLSYVWDIYHGNSASGVHDTQYTNTNSYLIYDFINFPNINLTLPTTFYIVCTITSNGQGACAKETCSHVVNLATIPKPSTPTCCRWEGWRQDDVYFTNNKKSAFCRSRLALTNVLFFCTLTARTSSYQKLVRYYFLHRAARMRAQAAGYWHKQNCKNEASIVGTGTANTYNASTCATTLWEPGIYVAEHHRILSNHEFWQGTAYLYNNLMVPNC